VVDNEHWYIYSFQFRHERYRCPGKIGRERKRFVGARANGPPDEINGLAIFLASADADYIVVQT
jgi:hypothetical protein